MSPDEFTILSPLVPIVVLLLIPILLSILIKISPINYAWAERVSQGLARFLFQFDNTVLTTSYSFLIGLVVQFVIGLMISFGVIWGIATAVGSDYPLAWAFLINFAASIPLSIYLTLRPQKKNPIRELFNRIRGLIEQSTGKQQVLGNLLVAEAMVRTCSYLLIIFLVVASTFMFAAGTWALNQIFGLLFLAKGTTELLAFWRYFFDHNFQIITVEIFSTLGIRFSGEQTVAGGGALVSGLLILVKITVVAEIYRIIRLAMKELNEIRSLVDREIDKAERAAAARSPRGRFPVVRPRIKVRKSILRPFYVEAHTEIPQASEFDELPIEEGDGR